MYLNRLGDIAQVPLPEGLTYATPAEPDERESARDPQEIVRNDPQPIVFSDGSKAAFLQRLRDTLNDPIAESSITLAMMRNQYLTREGAISQILKSRVDNLNLWTRRLNKSTTGAFVSWIGTGVALMGAGKLLSLALPGVGAAGAGGGAAAGGATAGAGAVAGSSAALAAPSTIAALAPTLLPEIVIVGSHIGTATYLAAGAAAAAGGIAAAGALSPVPVTTLPGIQPTMLPEIQITAAPINLPARLLPLSVAPMPFFSETLPKFTGTIESPGTDFGVPKDAPKTLTDELIELAKKYAIEYGKDEAIAYVQAEMQRKLAAADEARLRAEIDRMNRELRNLQPSLVPSMARAEVQPMANGDKIAAAIASLVVAWALKG